MLSMRPLWEFAGRRVLIGMVFVAAALELMPVAAQQKPAIPDYIVGANDVLAIAVFGQEKWTNKYTVAADGTFNFPNLGRVPAAGLTVKEVEDDLRDRLAKSVLRDPQVTVSVDQYRSQQILVIGEVRQPQPLQFMGAMRLTEALARVGSVNERAGVEALILRSPSGAAPDPAAVDRAAKPSNATDPNPNVIRVDLQALRTGDLSQDIALRSGDIVSVPAAQTVIVQGQVARTGEYPIRPGMTVQEVVALAGGTTDRGSNSRIQIIRMVDGKKVTTDAKLDDVVRGGDIINVRERFF